MVSKTLAERCREQREAGLRRLGDREKQILQAASNRVMESDFGEQALRSGEQAIDFTLPESRGDTVHLQTRIDQGPVVLSFYRGSWCPFCNLEIRALHEALPEIRKASACLIAISPELPKNNQLDTYFFEDGFEVASDPGNSVAGEYGLIMEVDESLRPLYLGWGLDIPRHNGDSSWKLPIPATYVIGRDGIIKAHYVDKNYTARMEPAEIITALDRLNTER